MTAGRLWPISNKRTVLCRQCDANSSPISWVWRILPRRTGRAARTQTRHIQLHGKNTSFRHQQSASTQRQRNQAPTFNFVTSRRLCQREMLSCPAASQTLAYKNLYLCINYIMQSSLALILEEKKKTLMITALLNHQKFEGNA